MIVPVCDHLEAMIEKTNDLTYYPVIIIISLSDLVAHHLTLLIHFNHLTTDGSVLPVTGVMVTWITSDKKSWSN